MRTQPIAFQKQRAKVLRKRGRYRGRFHAVILLLCCSCTKPLVHGERPTTTRPRTQSARGSCEAFVPGRPSARGTTSGATLAAVSPAGAPHAAHATRACGTKAAPGSATLPRPGVRGLPTKWWPPRRRRAGRGRPGCAPVRGARRPHLGREHAGGRAWPERIALWGKEPTKGSGCAGTAALHPGLGRRTPREGRSTRVVAIRSRPDSRPKRADPSP